MKVGASNCGLDVTRELMQEYKDAGLEYMEVSCGHLSTYEALDFDETRRLADEYGIKLWSFHLSFWPFEKLDIASLDEAKREYTIAVFKEQMEKAASIGIDKFVIHPCGEPYSDEEREECIAVAAQSLKRLSEIAISVGGVLCVENLPRTCLSRCSDDVLKLISLDENLRVCFDTNHLLIEDPLRFIERLGDKIVTVHVSDYDFINERHWLPGEGKLDFYKIYKALLDVGYEGIWNYEITPEGSTATIERSRAITFSDFYKNAQEIFEGKPLSTFGRSIV